MGLTDYLVAVVLAVILAAAVTLAAICAWLLIDELAELVRRAIDK